MAEYSDRALAELLGWEIKSDGHLQYPKWSVLDPAGKPARRDWGSSEAAWYMDGVKFRTDPAAMVALMERLRAMGRYSTVYGTPSIYRAKVYDENQALIVDVRADTPMAALAEAAWKALQP